MTKEELAEKFACEQNEKCADMIKAAYLKGYEMGAKSNEMPSTINVDGVTYVDLGLSSGTLWSSRPLSVKGEKYVKNRFSYNEAQKLNIPTVEQYKELYNNTKAGGYGISMYILGPNANRIYYDLTVKGEGIVHKDLYYCWLKSDVKNNEASVFVIQDCDGITELGPVCRSHFTGYELPIFLVKNKADL